MSTLAYIGPGAGFAVLGSFLILIAAVAMGLLSLLLLPLRLVLRALFRRRRLPSSARRRCVLIGLDGMDPRRAERLMEAGELPHLQRLRQDGTFERLGSTCPPISPVAWSSFTTGSNPGKHNIFDFLNRDLRTVMPELSSSRAGTQMVRRRIPLIGRWFNKRARAEVKLLRRGRPFWAELGARGIDATVLRVPVTFPVEPFRGRGLAAMCTPDLRGTQGEFTVFDSAPESGSLTGGRRITVTVTGDRADSALPGPELAGRTLSLPLSLRILAPDRVMLHIGDERRELTVGSDSPWVRLPFRLGRRRVHGIARFRLLSATPRLRLYVTPLNIDPERPAMPVSHPTAYSIYLAKRLGPYATLGLAEDTWALSEGVIDEDAFLTQCLDVHDERERMFADALAHTRNGLCACVFDITDRVQHMFHRFDSPDHPARRPGDDPAGRYARVIDDVYRRCDQLVGDTLRRLGPRDVLFVISDHGFADFRRGVNLNAWLREQGYLVTLPDAPAEAEYLRSVDWSKTRAYSFGLSGVYLNQAGREAQGIVPPGDEARALRRELAERLEALCDPADVAEATQGQADQRSAATIDPSTGCDVDDGDRRGTPVAGATHGQADQRSAATIDPSAGCGVDDGDRRGMPVMRGIYDAAETYRGPYSGNGPDLVTGFRSGYRASWENAVGRCDGPIFTDNTQAWSGDHCVDRREVPGVMFCNRRMTLDAQHPPHLADIGPTILGLWKIPAPASMDGRAHQVD